MQKFAPATYSSRYVSKASFAATSNFLSLVDGVFPSGNGGLYSLLQGDLKHPLYVSTVPFYISNRLSKAVPVGVSISIIVTDKVFLVGLCAFLDL